MNNLSTYIIEKLKINKDTKSNPKNPKTKEDIKNMVKEYFHEWVENDEIFKLPKSASKEDMEIVYNHIIEQCDKSTYRVDKFIRCILPAAFRKYMNKTYNLTIDETF